MTTAFSIEFAPEKPSKLRYLHEFTYPELEHVKEPVADHSGILWAGPDRKGMNAPNPVDLWKKWQSSVQRAGARAGFVPPHVEEYFQATKMFGKPPKKSEAEELAKMITKNGGDPAPVIEAVKQSVPKFTWSPTKLQAFETCPMQFAASYYYKTLPYQESEAIIWGNRVHKSCEDYLTKGGVTDPEAFKVVEKWVKFFEKMEGEKWVEKKISVNSHLQPCDYSDGEGRMIADLAIKNNDHILIIDWKTGKIKDDHTQLKIYALLLAIANPNVQKISYKYIWLKDGKVTGGELYRADLLPIAKDLKERLAKMKEAWAEEDFKPTPNGLCRNWCGVTECKHCGKGR